jgi:hypothetical protein
MISKLYCSMQNMLIICYVTYIDSATHGTYLRCTHSLPFVVETRITYDCDDPNSRLFVAESKGKFLGCLGVRIVIISSKQESTAVAQLSMADEKVFQYIR